MGAGLQQGLDYSATLGIPFVFASNDDGFVFHDKILREGESLPTSQRNAVLWTGA